MTARSQSKCDGVTMILIRYDESQSFDLSPEKRYISLAKSGPQPSNLIKQQASSEKNRITEVK